MLNSKVKSFDCYGKGWLFDNHEGHTLKDKIDLSKFEWNKGYTLAIQHFGVLDPLFGDYDSDSPWESDANFVAYVLKTNKLVDAWLNNQIIKNLAEGLDIEANVENLNLLLEVGIDRDSGHYIRDTLNGIGFGNNFALCGITDKDYFTDLVLKLGYNLEKDSQIDVIFLG